MEKVFVVLVALCAIDHDGDRIAEGARLSLPENQAAPLVGSGAARTLSDAERGETDAGVQPMAEPDAAASAPADAVAADAASAEAAPGTGGTGAVEAQAAVAPPAPAPAAAKRAGAKKR